MTDGTRRNWWLVAGGFVVASLMFAIVAKLVLEPEPRTQPPRSRRVPAPAAAEAPSSPRDAVPVREPEQQAPPLAEKQAEAAGVACGQAADCRGPKSADCIVASCEAGRCVFDRSRCECVGDGECDDGVECTRDLCFAATKKCIHIRSACK